MRLASIEAFLKERGEPAFRLAQIADAVFKRGVTSYLEIGALPKELREALAARGPVLSFEAEDVKSSKSGDAQKAVLRLPDGQRVETVLMSPKPEHWTVCVSSQVGCALACTFCATGLMGFTRNLTDEEISDQVLFWRQRAARGLGGSPSNVVYMGMGEPLLNWPQVLASIRALTDPRQLGLGRRHISISTAGIAPGIETLAEELPQVNLALSLHAATDEERVKLVPLNRAYPLDRLRDALKAYLKRTNRKIFIEYTLLRGENDSAEHAWRLARFLRSVGPPSLLHVNLIVWNPTDTPHHASRAEDARRFKAALEAEGMPATIRKNLGQDIEGACGQLVVRTGNLKAPGAYKGTKP